jgi:hypothetical protein
MTEMTAPNLADPSAGVTLPRPARRISVVLMDPIRVADLPGELKPYARSADELAEENQADIDRVPEKAEKILDVAVSSDTACENMPVMVDAARAYMELADRHL